MSKSEWCSPHALSRTDHDGCKWSACECPCHQKKEDTDGA